MSLNNLRPCLQRKVSNYTVAAFLNILNVAAVFSDIMIDIVLRLPCGKIPAPGLNQNSRPQLQ